MTSFIKILTERLKGILHRIIRPLQFVFVKGKLIHDNVILSQEILHKLREAKAKDAMMALKIDLNKAYEKINRGTIIEVMRRLGFSIKWCELIFLMYKFTLFLNYN